MAPPRHHHGSIRIGRIMVVVCCLFIVLADALVFREDKTNAYPLPGTQLVIAISLVWLAAGAAGLIMRRPWGRYFLLIVIYIFCVTFFITAIIVVASGEGEVAARLKPLSVTTIIYLVISLVLTQSKNVRRLTSRQWD
jgi:hypothetical protein